MKTKILLLLCAAPLIGADPAGFVLWSASDIKEMSNQLKTQIGDERFKAKPLEKFGNHYAMVTLRQGRGGAEVHETDADIFIAESGTAKLIVGGKLISAKTTAPHEVRGTGIEGGVEKNFSAGDIVHIPAKTPHQLIITSKDFAYFVFKVSGQ